MKAKIIAILVMTLLITAGTIVVADWEIGDGHKMHYPQLPNPVGWDVDWGDWYLGDDWKCNESGPVDDIHFWYSWKGDDDDHEIPTIYVSIWSNYEGPPSEPEEKLWDRTFYYIDDFKIAGPWYGDQGWYNPETGDYLLNDHIKYYQINIPDIQNPFPQVKDEIYWLVIKMPFEITDAIGWKTSNSTQFEDTAVYGEPYDWTSFYDPDQQELDLAFVITSSNDPPNDPDPDGPTYVWAGEENDYIITSEDLNLDKISYYIDWGDGTFTPWSPFYDSGVGYNCSHIWEEQGIYILQAKAKDIHGAESGWGELEITVPRNKAIISSLFYHLLEQFPILQWLFQRLIGLQ